MNISFLGTVSGALALAACAGGKSEPATTPAPAPVAYAQLQDSVGAAKARAVITETKDGVDVGLVATSMPTGTYAFHIHAVGTCTPPDFTSAGGHFNPTDEKHGHHKGDLPNLVVGSDGTGRVEAHVAGVSLTAGKTPIIDADGAAIVIHARPDDGVTDPSGNAGPRLACGVIVTK